MYVCICCLYISIYRQNNKNVLYSFIISFFYLSIKFFLHTMYQSKQMGKRMDK